MYLDQINCMLTLDNMLTNEMEGLLPHKSMFSLSRPYETSSNASMPKPVVSTISAWLHSPYDTLDQHKLEITRQLAIVE